MLVQSVDQDHVYGMCAPEHAHIATIWHPAMNLATECVEKEHLVLRYNEGVPQIWAYKMKLIYILKYM